ncbi:Organic cation/carnitine transporter [Arachis hypogaea]|nr:Organic cation/carnitine transporter [Arachis hypogaea]
MVMTLSSNYDELRTLLVTTAAMKLRHFIFTSLAWALEAYHTMVMIFADRETEWRCTAGAYGAVGSTCGIQSEERE